MKISRFIIKKLQGKDICEGYSTWTDYGYEYDCGYYSDIECEYCLFSKRGFDDPRKDENGIYNKIIAPILRKIFRIDNV